MSTAKDKVEKLESIIKKYKKILVAFSGGIDSSYLVYKCSQVVGKDNVFPITGVSETYTKEEYAFAKEFSEKLGVNQLFVNTFEFENNDFINNPKDRCYLCKKELYREIKKKADEVKADVIFDGTNFSDQFDYRPGRKATKEFNVVSPLLETGLKKEEIRSLLRDAGFDFFNKPANPCLASRIPYGEKITQEKLIRIEACEKFLKDLGFFIVRVRAHESLAKIEIGEKDFSRLLEKDLREKISLRFKEIGFTWVSFDIDGYRTGSLNEKILKKS